MTTDATPAVTPPTVTVDANLRAGPGLEFAVLGGTITGQTIAIVGRNADGTWYRLDNTGWVAAQLVLNAPPLESIPVLNADGTPVAPAGAAPATRRRTARRRRILPYADAPAVN